jgi:hypothetical protein
VHECANHRHYPVTQFWFLEQKAVGVEAREARKQGKRQGKAKEEASEEVRKEPREEARGLRGPSEASEVSG